MIIATAKPVAIPALCTVLLISTGCAQPRADRSVTTRQLEQILATQTKAWNAGDIDRYMSHYWRSEHLTFSSGGHTKRGWEATRDGYRRRYPTRERMGTLKFTDLETRLLGDNAALMLGRWHLTRDSDSLDGNFSLVFQRFKYQWKIIHDHTSLTPPKGDE